MTNMIFSYRRSKLRKRMSKTLFISSTISKLINHKTGVNKNKKYSWTKTLMMNTKIKGAERKVIIMIKITNDNFFTIIHSQGGKRTIQCFFPRNTSMMPSLPPNMVNSLFQRNIFLMQNTHLIDKSRLFKFFSFINLCHGSYEIRQHLSFR